MASNDHSDSLHRLCMALFVGMLIGGAGVYVLAPPALRLDPSFMSTFDLATTTARSEQAPPLQWPPPQCLPPPASPCTHTVAADELLARGNLEQNPKNAPIVDDYSAPRIVPLEEFVTPEECAQLIQLVTGSERFEAGQVANPSGQNRSPNRKVSMTVLQLAKYRWLYERLMETITFYNTKYWNYRLPTNVTSTLLEPIQFYKYDGTEQGHYNWHSDVGIKGPTAKRRLSVSVQLSAENSYEGGEFMIQTSAEPLALMRTQGSMFLFPSFVLHKVAPVTRGTRYSLVAWIETA